MEKKKVKKPKTNEEILKTRKIVIAIVIVLFIIILFIISGVSDYQDTRYNDLNDDYQSIKSDYSDLESKYKNISKEDEQAKIEEEINSLNSQKESLQDEVNTLTEQKNQLNLEIISIKGQPMSFPAGYFTAGTDFEAGRYKIYDGNNNFVVYDILGDLKVNIILGNDPQYEVSEYIYTFNTGDKIEADSSFKLVLVS